MSKNAISGIMLTLLLIGMSPLTFTPVSVMGSFSTKLYIDTPSIVDPSLTPGKTFTADVMVSDIEYLYAWQVNMSFNPTVLKITDIIEGDFLKSQPEGTYGVRRIENEDGWGLFAWTTKGVYVGVSGSGTLATVKFEVLAEGESLIKIETDPRYLPESGHWVYPTFLRQQLSPYPPPNWNDLYPPEDFTTQNGYFNNFAPPTVYKLIDTIESWHLRKGTEKSLIAKLKVAGHMLDIGKEDGAIRKLTAFINRVETLRERTLTNEQADYLISEAQRIIDFIQS